jgi:hypothetical protein
MTLSKNARIAGLLYLLGSLFGIVRLIYVPNTLFVYGNATATAKNIAEHELLFRFGIVSYLICAALWIFVTLALACFAYLALSFTGFLLPDYEDQVNKIAQPLVLGELATMLWLLIMGANEKPRVV